MQDRYRSLKILGGGVAVFDVPVDPCFEEIEPRSNYY